MKLKLAFIVSAFLIAGCGEPPAPEPQTAPVEEQVLTESERLTQWFDEKYEEVLLQSPSRLTMLGRKDRYGDLDDLSMEAQREMVQWMQQTAETLQEEFDYTLLDEEAQTSYDMWLYQTDRQTRAFEYSGYGYVFNQMSSMHTNLPQLLLAFHRVDNKSDMEAYISRLYEFERVLTTLLNQAQERAEDGIRPPRFAYEGALRQSRNLLRGTPFDDSEEPSTMWADIESKVQELLDAGELTEEEAGELLGSARNALITSFQSGYEQVNAWLESDMEHAETNTVGVSRHESGDDYYNFMLWYHTTTDLSAEEIHQIGLEDVNRIQNEMLEIMREVEFDGSLEDFFEFIRTDDQFFYPDTDEGRQAYLDDSKAYLDALEDKLPEFFGILPKADLVVRRVESFREEDGAPQHYYPGTPDGSRPGIYYAHLSDMSAMPKVDMEAVAYHEGNPGHHMQISIAQELQGLPFFRTQERFTVYTEGWALYSELLAKEMGGYEDPYSDFGRLTAEIWRAARLVVDTGMHALGWTEEEAVNYMLENTPITEGSIRAEIRRYLVMPGQATAYKIGMIRIQEMRERAEQELGELFDIRAFHDTVLGGGSLPLPLLEARVDNWIERVKTGAGEL